MENVAAGTLSLDEFVGPAKPTDDLLHLRMAASQIPASPIPSALEIFRTTEYPSHAMTADGPAGLRIRPEVGVHLHHGVALCNASGLQLEPGRLWSSVGEAGAEEVTGK